MVVESEQQVYGRGVSDEDRFSLRPKMDMHLPVDAAKGYKSPAQKARVMTESWALENLYCPACTSNRIDETRNNTSVVDFVCPSCQAAYQLKAKRNSLGRKIVDAAYGPMVKAILKGSFPHLLLLSYGGATPKVNNLIVVPSFCLPVTAIEARKPLSKTARRAGWIGCNIILDLIPPDGRISVISVEQVIAKSIVRKEFNSTKPLEAISSEKRGWTLDVLTLLRSLSVNTFTLKEAYSFESSLSDMHPGNRHVRPKIRQQLQVLRDLGYIEFLGGGVYRWRDNRHAADKRQTNPSEIS